MINKEAIYLSTHRINELREVLENAYEKYHITPFIDADPVKFIHAFNSKPDKEIAGLFAALFAWGNRQIILNKLELLFSLMNFSPYKFLMQNNDKEFNQFKGFVHRTFMEEDIIAILSFLRNWYAHHDSLEYAFQPLGCQNMVKDAEVKHRIIGFKHRFQSIISAENRVQKHISTPEKNSACKRINLFLRWMVRKDDKGIDIGIWESISTASLQLPLDVHSLATAQNLGLIASNAKPNWKTTEELTNTLKIFDANDPIRFDYSLFSLGVDGFNKTKQSQ